MIEFQPISKIKVKYSIKKELVNYNSPKWNIKWLNYLSQPFQGPHKASLTKPKPFWLQFASKRANPPNIAYSPPLIHYHAYLLSLCSCHVSNNFYALSLWVMCQANCTVVKGNQSLISSVRPHLHWGFNLFGIICKYCWCN